MNYLIVTVSFASQEAVHRIKVEDLSELKKAQEKLLADGFVILACCRTRDDWKR